MGGGDLVQTPENIRRGRRGGGTGRELAQAAGTGAHGPWSPIPDPISGLAPALGKPWSKASLRECERGRLCLKLLSVFRTASAPRRESRLQKWPPGPEEKGLPPLPVPVLGGPTCPQLRGGSWSFSREEK